MSLALLAFNYALLSCWVKDDTDMSQRCSMRRGRRWGYSCFPRRGTGFKVAAASESQSAGKGRVLSTSLLKPKVPFLPGLTAGCYAISRSSRSTPPPNPKQPNFPEPSNLNFWRYWGPGCFTSKSFPGQKITVLGISLCPNGTGNAIALEIISLSHYPGASCHKVSVAGASSKSSYRKQPYHGRPPLACIILHINLYMYMKCPK